MKVRVQYCSLCTLSVSEYFWSSEVFSGKLSFQVRDPFSTPSFVFTVSLHSHVAVVARRLQTEVRTQDGRSILY